MPLSTDLDEQYAAQGFAVVPEPIVDRDLVARAAVAVDRVVAGEYVTGNAPSQRFWNPGDDPSLFVKIDQVHRCDPALLEVASHTGIGAVAATATGAMRVQVWATQLVVKPSGPGDGTALGWHQDDLYWRDFWDGEVFTCWVALADVGPDAGPVTYVAGSQTWPVVDQADFRRHDLDTLRSQLDLPADATWTEHAAVLPRGGVVLHHKRTMHASPANTSGHPRIGYVLHLCTDRAEPRPGAAEFFQFDLDDPQSCPVLFDGDPRYHRTGPKAAT
jgi:ectoine hydroxylase-related dioxygenase (phytanoyl-CoA dioxygenase family)